jgi:predicted DNA binding CopG/RHH family protein
MTTERDQRGQPASKIPVFHSREEEAEFWDTHDFTEFLDETRPVKLRIGKQLSEGLTVRLDRHDREELERRASEQGIGPSTLVRMWIKERLRGTQHPSS